jgi:peptide/nickel transport system ATP-binding protein
MEINDTILEVKNLRTDFRINGETTPIIKGISFQVRKGSTLAIVGESGCGKSVTVHSVMQLLPKIGRIAAGEVVFRSDGKEYRLDTLQPFGKQMRSIRGRCIGMIFQDPMASLNPVCRVGDQVTENLVEHFQISKKEAQKKVVDMFASLGIPDPEKRVHDYPHQFSGGMKQRVMIAIAMICNPDLLIADEPTTALDVTIQAQIMDLMESLKRKQGKSIILITHNIGLVAETADYVAVMYMGRIMESGTVERIFHRASHPYTRALMRSVPVLGRNRGEKLITIRGMAPDPSECQKGCEFANRCDDVCGKCRDDEIGNHEIEPGHFVRCVLYSPRREA